MAHVLIAGGGLAGMAAAQSLAEAGFRVTLFESRPFLGGRASSYPLREGEQEGEIIDNCQHILLRCCTNLLDFFRKLGVEDKVRFFREYYFLEPGGRLSVLRRGVLPRPFHFLGSFCRLAFLPSEAKVKVAEALAGVWQEWGHRKDLDRLTMLEWLREKQQPEVAIRRFWAPVLVSAINEDLEDAAARYGLQVFRLAFLGRASAYEMGVPSAPLGELYNPEALAGSGAVKVRLRSPVERFVIGDGRVQWVESRGERWEADYYVSALPVERIEQVAPELGIRTLDWDFSPITGIHLWFDRPVTDLPHAALLDRTIQWFFNKRDGRYLMLVVSASRKLVDMGREEIVELARRQLAEFLPESGRAELVKAHVAKEVRATFSPAPGVEVRRPAAPTEIENLFLAGDWTRSGWPATMEGAVRSGRLAAEAVCEAAGDPRRFLLPDPC
ncbi:MAG: hydroxysqualene dehydroxylase HpnE [Bryobacteraceae bacterium]